MGKETRINKLTRGELKVIILALLTKNPLCGHELKLEIFQQFRILPSSGTLYPLLHELENLGLLKSSQGIKTKTYELIKKESILKIIGEHVQAKDSFNHFLKSAIIGPDNS